MKTLPFFPPNFIPLKTMVVFATLQGSLLRSQFLGQDNHFSLITKTSTKHKRKPTCQPQPRVVVSEFNILKLMGGRGLCNGEKGLEQELKRKVDNKEETTSSSNEKVEENSEKLTSDIDEIPEDGFDKEMMGLTGGFPGGEKGLIKFIQENPPRSRNSSDDSFIIKESNQSLPEESKTIS